MIWLWSNLDFVWDLTVAHVMLSVFPIVIGFLLSLPLGWVANRYRMSRGVLLTISGVLYAVPSLPLFVAMPALIGTQILDPKNVVIALSLYALALMVRTTTDALGSVPGDVQQSATAIGFSAWRRFWSVDLPLAGPVLLAGIRVVSVSTVSLVSIGSLIGVSTLGTMFVQGLYQYNNVEVTIGLVMIVIIAVLFDLALVLLGRLLLPWTRLGTTRRVSRRAALEAVAGT